MQTKNINIDRAPQNNDNTNQSEKYRIVLQNGNGHGSTNGDSSQQAENSAPPLPPRAAIIFTPLPTVSKQVEVEGYGPYKPVPPPKPLPQQPQGQGRNTPPPYRMPPYPLYNEPSIPGAAGLDSPAASATPAGPQSAFQTHSSKFPIEREVILSSTDKNSKIPILHDLKKKGKASIAPDAPPKQMAWTQAQMQNHQILPDQTHSGLIQTIQQTPENGPVFRATYHPGEYYNGTGAVPRTWQGDPNKLAPRPYHEETLQSVTVQVERAEPKEKTNGKSMTKTYHTIKDIISSRFKSNKESEEKAEEGLNNVVAEDKAKEEEKKQELYGKARAEQIQYSPHYLQQHMLAQQAQQQYQQLKTQQQLAARSQELLAREDLYYQGNFPASPQRAKYNQTPQGFVQVPVEKERPVPIERRSAQQIERDTQRRSFEARRAASQPQLAFDEADNKPQPQAASASRRGSYNNVVEAQDVEKDSDDGGFLKRKEGEEKVTEALQGSPRKRLEGEIGKIEGVYNVQRKTEPKANPSSATSSDYDKTGQSSSNVDSGRGSAAYSSGRRAGADLNENIETPNSTYTRGNDSEWVDIVENELRHILEPKLHELSLHGNSNSVLSESISSVTPPLPPLSPGDQSSPNLTPRNTTKFKHSSLPYGSKPDYDSYKTKNHSRDLSSRYNGTPMKQRSKKMDHSSLRSKQMFGLDTTDLTSTTTRSMDLESMLDGQSDSDGDISTADARTIRKQLEGLESMYSEVLKFLGMKKHGVRYQPSDPRFSKRRYGSMSSLPSSSVSSRPIRDKRRASEERKKVRDIRGINKRFQRLESHVVTLARSVAHLSSEMRTQHLMIQEMENIRGEIAALRTQTNMLNVRSQSASKPSSKDLPMLSNPDRVKKLTKFFGDEPPILRLFLKKLGYEKYASLFETERVGMVELPYLTEEKLQKIGVPLGPRLRIMQEARISVSKDNTLCIV